MEEALESAGQGVGEAGAVEASEVEAGMGATSTLLTSTKRLIAMTTLSPSHTPGKREYGVGREVIEATAIAKATGR